MEFLPLLKLVGTKAYSTHENRPHGAWRRGWWCMLLGVALSVAVGGAQKPDHSMENMPGMHMEGMEDMGPSMAAMAGHMTMTSLRVKQPGDEEKVKAVVAQVKATIERYKDYRKALADGYVIANPKVNQPQFHFNNPANIK